VRFELLTAVTRELKRFFDIKLRSAVGKYQGFGGTYSIFSYGDEGRIVSLSKILVLLYHNIYGMMSYRW
jgi:hypothetical protein